MKLELLSETMYLINLIPIAQQYSLNSQLTVGLGNLATLLPIQVPALTC